MQISIQVTTILSLISSNVYNNVNKDLLINFFRTTFSYHLEWI